MQSYEEKIKTCLDDIVGKFIEDVSNKFSVSKSELESLWKTKEKEKVIKKEEKKNVCEYNSLKKDALVKMCNERNLDVRGTKKDIIKRLIGNDNKEETIINKLEVSLNSVVIKKDGFGNYIHSPTSFVFNKDTKCVIGKDVGEGNIIQLDKNDINICNRYKFKYNIPDDLNDGNDEEVEDIIDESDSDEEDEESDDED